MLSPCIWQVIHALLTRRPLTYISLGFNISPFDLHVLSTPPAFILSQDQTLMFKCLIWHQLNWLIIRDWISSIFYFIKGSVLWTILLRIFRVALLFICQGTSLLSMPVSFATAFIDYHKLSYPVKHFFYFFCITCGIKWYHPSYLYRCWLLSVLATKIILPLHILSVNSKLQFFRFFRFFNFLGDFFILWYDYRNDNHIPGTITLWFNKIQNLWLRLCPDWRSCNFAIFE